MVAGPVDFGKSKSEGVRSMTRGTAVGGGDSGRGSYDSAEDSSNAGMGPTGSSRSYPKGSASPSSTQNATQFNPQKQSVTDIYVGGVP